MDLKGIDALNKASRLMESLIVPEKKDSFSNVEKTYNAANGKTYGIVKEGAKYIIKESNSSKAYLPEHFDYIQGVQNKQKYSKETILEAEKTIHLWNIEFKRIHGNKFLNEQEENKKMVLKVPGAKKSAAPEAPMPTDAAPMPPAEGGEGMPADAAMPPAEGGEMPMDVPSGEGMPEMPEGGAPAEGGADIPMDMPEEGGEEPEEGDEEGDDEDPTKLIQKLAGKLAYELREFQGEDEEYGDLANFALGMVAAAVNPEKLSSTDIKKLKKKVDKNLKKDSDELDLDYPGSEEDMPQDEDMPEDEGADDMPKGDEEGSDEGVEKTLAEIFKKIKEGKKKLSPKQRKLDKNKNNKLDAEDFRMLRGSKNKESLKEFKDYMMEDDSDVYFEEKTDNLLLDIDPLNEYGDLYEDDYLSEEEMGLMEMGDLYEDEYLSEESYSDLMNEEDLFSEEEYLREFNKLHEDDYLNEDDYLMNEDDDLMEFDLMEDDYLNEDDIFEFELDEDYFQEGFKKKARW